MFDGSRFGYSPITPNIVAETIVRLEANHAFHHAVFAARASAPNQFIFLKFAFVALHTGHSSGSSRSKT